MIWPLLIFAGCFAGGAAAAARYLPDLDAGIVGGIAFLLVCGLLGAALSIVGLHLYELIRQLKATGGFNVGKSTSLLNEGDIIAGQIDDILFEAGSVTAFAAIVYLLAPRALARSARAAVGSVAGSDPTSVG